MVTAVVPRKSTDVEDLHPFKSGSGSLTTGFGLVCSSSLQDVTTTATSITATAKKIECICCLEIICRFFKKSAKSLEILFHQAQQLIGEIFRNFATKGPVHCSPWVEVVENTQVLGR